MQPNHTQIIQSPQNVHSEQCLWWIPISLDIVFGTATDTAHLQEWNKMFQVIFYNPRDWIQLLCNKLMDTVKIFGHFTVAVNDIIHIMLGSTGVGLAHLKKYFPTFEICLSA